MIAAPVAASAAALPPAYLGRWDVTLETPDRALPTWLELVNRDGAPAVRMVGRWGNARWLPSAEFVDGKLRFVSPAKEEGRKDDMVFEGRLAGKFLVGQTTGPDGTVWKWRGERAPSLARTGKPAWGKPITLFNGRDLAGWHPSDAKAPDTWRIEGGSLVSLGNGPELITDGKFDDFRLHI